MKIALVNHLYPPHQRGGAERSVQVLAEALALAGHDVCVICTGPRAAYRRLNGVRVYELKLRNIYWHLDQKASAPRRLLWHTRDIHNRSMATLVEQILERERPDVVHTHVLAGFSVAVWRAVRRLGIPLLHTIRDYYLLCPRSTMFRAGRNCEVPCASCRMFSSLKRDAARLVQHVIGISTFVLERHQRLGWFRATPSTVLRNGVVPATPGWTASRRDGPVRVGYLGRLHPSKGVELLIDAFVRSGAGRDSELVVAGTGVPEDVAKLRRMARGQRVTFTGFVAPASLFQQVDLLVVPSLWHEPLGRVLLEAYAHGLPVLAARRGGIAEIVSAGKTGWLFDPDRPSELCEHLAMACADRAALRRMRQHCLELAASFAPERIADQHLELYRSMLARGVEDHG